MPRNDQTTVIQGWVDRLHQGDDSARAALLGCAADRLARLTRKMLKGYPGVARWKQPDDVLQNALIRLDRALKAVTPPTARDFFRLAAAQVCRDEVYVGGGRAGRLSGGAVPLRSRAAGTASGPDRSKRIPRRRGGVVGGE
jgi:hypothetical protein